MKKIIKIVLIVLVAAFLAAQFVRPEFANPPVDPKHELQAPQNVQAILDRSCIDCHTNRTRYPWYSRISPVSWWLKDHIDEGRDELNFSEFASYSARRKSRKFEEICDQVKQGEMPLREYTWGHPSAKLSDEDRKTLCEWSTHERGLLPPVPPRSSGGRGRS
jgi:hypothetical protein